MKAFKIFLVASLVIFTGCATAPYPYSTTSYSSTSSSGVNCVSIPGHTKSNGEYVDDYYRCDGVQSSSQEFSSGICRWIDAYTKNDGTHVSGHTRCSSNVSTRYREATPPAPSSTPAVPSSNCHYVSGYTTKKGKRVSGYMRCR